MSVGMSIALFMATVAVTLASLVINVWVLSDRPRQPKERSSSR